MSDRGVTESVVEQAALAWLESVGWQVVNGAEIAPGEPDAERENYGQVILERRLRDALARLNPKLPSEALDDAFRKLLRPEGAELILQNRAAHRLLVDGVTVEYRDGDGEIRGAQARVIDFDRPEANDWLAVNQFSVAENKHARRPDVVLFVNGLPLARDRAEERGGRECDDLERVPAAADLSGRGAVALRHQRAARRLGWRGGPRRRASAPGGSGSSRGAPSRARRWPTRIFPSCRS